MDRESIEAVEPDVEIIVRIGKLEVAVFGLFQNKHDVWDVVVGVDDVANRDGIETALNIASGAIQVATFNALRTTGPGESGGV